MRGFWFGLKLGLQGLLSKELRSRSRGWRSMLLLTGYLGALTLGAAGYLYIAIPKGEVLRPTVGAQFFMILATGFVILLAMVTPALTSGSVSGERERKTLDLLLITQASPLGLIAGKWLGSVLYILYLLLASLPAFALVYLFGGVPVVHLGLVMLVAAVTALTYSALGLLLSALFKRTGVASLVSYVLVFFLVFGLPFVGMLQSSSSDYYKYGYGSPQPPATPVYSYASPLTAVSSVLPGTGSYSGGSLFQDLISRVIRRPVYDAPRAMEVSFGRVQVVRAVNPQTGQPEYDQIWAPWVTYSAISVGITGASLGLATLAIAPVKTGQAWRVRRRNRRVAGVGQTTPVS